MHPRNPHKDRYNFPELIKANAELKSHVIPNKRGEDSINFDNPESVKALNRAILYSMYGIKHWEIPKNFLCPPIPGRADYIHHLADLFPVGKKLRGLDVGVGANCIYPIIGHKVYGWKFVGSDINEEALKAANTILNANDLGDSIELRLQNNSEKIFSGILKPSESFDFSMCNPPFHSSPEEAQTGTDRKRRNLKLGHKGKLNFGGKSNELWCEGGEKAFVARMIEESALNPTAVIWYTSLISKEANLPFLEKKLKTVKCKTFKIINMSQGQKKSRILAWSFTTIPLP